MSLEDSEDPFGDENERHLNCDTDGVSNAEHQEQERPLQTSLASDTGERRGTYDQQPLNVREI